eukprot:1158099-Pelagomonas_calceolata.AAC.7
MPGVSSGLLAGAGAELEEGPERAVEGEDEAAGRAGPVAEGAGGTVPGGGRGAGAGAAVGAAVAPSGISTRPSNRGPRDSTMSSMSCVYRQVGMWGMRHELSSTGTGRDVR